MTSQDDVIILLPFWFPQFLYTDSIYRSCIASRGKNCAVGMLKLTTEKHEASRGLSATAELLVTFLQPLRCSGYVVRGTVYVVRIIFEVLPQPSQPPRSLVLKLLLKLTTVQTVRTSCNTVLQRRDHGFYGSTSCCISQCPVPYTVKFDAVRSY